MQILQLAILMNKKCESNRFKLVHNLLFQSRMVFVFCFLLQISLRNNLLKILLQGAMMKIKAEMRIKTKQKKYIMFYLECLFLSILRHVSIGNLHVLVLAYTIGKETSLEIIAVMTGYWAVALDNYALVAALKKERIYWKFCC